MKVLLILLAALVLGACAAGSPQITVVSQPPGASIVRIDNGLALGQAPVALAIPLDDPAVELDAQGCALLPGIEARWVSGARASIRRLRLCQNMRGPLYVDIERPFAYPNIEADLELAKQIELRRVEERFFGAFEVQVPRVQAIPTPAGGN